MVFEDLRARAGARNAADNAQRSDGTYDFGPQGSFQAGQDAGTPLQNAASQISQGYYGTGNLIYSQRQAGDYTQYAGPYAATSTFFAPTYTSDPFLGGRRNVHLGPVNIGLGMTVVGEYNDNVTRSGVDPMSDFITSAFLNISANYQITQKSSLSLSTAIGFDHYFDHPELSPYGNDFVLNVLPGSTIALDGTIGPVYVVLYNRTSVRPAAQNDFALNDRSIFGVVQNDTGLGASWNINSRTSLSVNYMHSVARTMDSNREGVDFGRYDRDSDAIQGSLAWTPDGISTFGLEGGVTWISYPEHFNNDGTIGNIGVFWSAPLGKTTSIRVGAGFQTFNFDPPPAFSGSLADDDRRVADAEARVTSLNQQIADTNANNALTPDQKQARVNSLTRELSKANTAVTSAKSLKDARTVEFNSSSRDSSDLSDFYYNVTFSNRLSSRISHALTFGHESSLNTISNYITADYVSYGVGIVAWAGSRLSLSGYYENAQDSGGRLAEDIEQWGFDAYLSHQLTPRLRAGLGYHYGISDSNLPLRSYTQQAFNVDLSYALTRKMLVSLGYRFLTTDADDPIFNYDQNRFVISANYNF